MSMNGKELEHAIALGESSTLQFKREWSDNNAIAREIIAFANGKGGTMVFGVEDKTGIIVGLDYSSIQSISSMVGNVANENVVPSLYVTTEAVDIQGKNLLVVEIPQGSNKPYKTLKGEIFVKQGADKRIVKENTQILRLFHESGNYYPDKEGVEGTSIEDLNERFVDNFFSRTFGRDKSSFDMDIKKLYDNLHITDGQGRLTLAGLLFFGNHPEWARPQFIVKAVAFVGNDLGGTQYRDSRDLEGTLPEVFDKAMDFCENNLHHIQAGQSFNSIGKLEISRIALEELVQNALVHRLYLIDAPIRLLIFDNRIEIVSPGCLSTNVTLDQIKVGNTYTRNPLIANLCSKTMNYRGLGSGIIRAMQDGDNIEFVNDEQGDKFVAIVHRKNKVFGEKFIENNEKFGENTIKFGEKAEKFGIKSKVFGEKFIENTERFGEKYDETTLAILSIIPFIPNMSAMMLSDFLGLSSRTIEKRLDQMKKLGLIRRIGPNKGGRWEICK